MKILTIIKKEILDQSRDKRTIIANILLPVLIVPLLLFITSQNNLTEINQSKIRIIPIGEQSQIKALLMQNSLDNIEFISSLTPEITLQNGQAELSLELIVIPGKSDSLQITYDSARQNSVISFAKLQSILKKNGNFESYNSKSEILIKTLRNEDESKSLLTLSLILPVLMMVFSASAAMSVGIDMSSGEKERSTLETLLSCHISAYTIVAGKLAASALIGFASIISLFLGLIISSQIHPPIIGGVPLLQFCSLGNIFLIICLGMIATLVFASCGLMIGFYARSVKEGTILTLPVILLSSTMASGLIAPDPFTFKMYYLFIPILNLSLLIKSILFNHYNILPIFIAVLVNLCVSGLLFIIACSLLKKESVVFRN